MSEGEEHKADKEAAELPPGVAKGAIRDNAEVICFAVILILFFKTFVGQQFTIPSASMRNTLMIGDHLLANKFLFARPQWDWERRFFPMRSVRRGDIIVFRYPLNRDQDYVKRCVAVGGDRVEIRNKRLFVNGNLVTGPFEHHRLSDDVERYVGKSPVYRLQPEPGPWPLERDAGKTVYQQNLEAAQAAEALPMPPRIWPFDSAEYPLFHQANHQGAVPLGRDGEPVYARDDLAAFTVPQGQVMAMGDNRDNSEDSRYWGFVPEDHLRGRPFLIWWSYREGGYDDIPSNVAEDPGGVFMNFLDGARHFFTRTRWERTGTLPR